MNHPLAFVPADKRKPLFYLFLGLTLVIFATFRVLDTPLRTEAAPNGVVSFELAGNIKTAAGILSSWDERAQLFAAFGLGLDYLFMPSYAVALALGILLAAGRHPGMFEKIGAWLGWGALAAGVFDAVENYSLWQLMLGDFEVLWPRLAAICATIKFALLLVGITYALIGWLWKKSK